MTLETAPSTQVLLDLEDACPGVLGEPLPGSSVPFWPQVRSAFMFAIMDHFFATTSVPKSSSRVQIGRRALAAFGPSRRDPRWLRGPRPLVYLTSGTTTHLVNSRTRNWLVGDFAEAFPRESVILQSAPLPAQLPAFEPTRSLSRFDLRAGVRARLGRAAATVARDVERMVSEYARLLDIPIAEDRIRAITNSATYHQALQPFREHSILKMIDRLDPLVALIQGASYGTGSSLVLALKRRGVHVVEPQHGWIGPSHGAYNFGAAMFEPELAAMLPDELLTFGEYWSSGIRAPYATTSIGKPHLEAMCRGAQAWERRPQEVLLVSSVADPGEATEFGRALADALPDGWTLRFRPHPSERVVVRDRYAALLEHRRVALDLEHDVYVSLRSSRVVVGVASTVLFEALALGCRVFAVANAVSPYYVGDLFGSLVHGPDSVTDIIGNLAPPSRSVSRETLDALWKPNATQNFREWADRRLQTTTSG